ncbi:MAG: MFS transporter [Anaerolineales bacterium]
MSTENSKRSWAAPFFAIWSGQAASLLGSQLVQFALVWWLTAQTGSEVVLATAAMLASLPQVFIGPFAGVLVDRWNRRRVMIVADAGIALATLLLLVLNAVGSMQPWHIYLLMFVRAVGGIFHWPAMQASTSLMVPGEQLARVGGMNQTLQGALSIVSPALGALLVGILPLYGILAIDVVTALLAIVPLLFIAIPQPEVETADVSERPTVLRDMITGFSYVWGWPGLFIILLMAMLLNFLSAPSFSLMPLLVTKHFSGGVVEIGALQSALGVGLLVGGVVLSVWGGFRRKVATSMLGMIGGGVGMLVVGGAPGSLLWMAIAGIFVTGFMNPIINGPLMALIQSAVDPKMQGRVFTLVLSLATAMMPLGYALGGRLAARFGISMWFVMAGVAMIGCGSLGFVIPAVRHIEGNPEIETHVDQAAALDLV